MEVVYSGTASQLTIATLETDSTGMTALDDVSKAGVSVGQMAIVVVFLTVSVTSPRASCCRSRLAGASLLLGVETLQFSLSKATVPLIVTKWLAL